MIIDETIKKKQHSYKDCKIPYESKNVEFCEQCKEHFIVYVVKGELRTIHPCPIEGVKTYHGAGRE